MEEVEYLCDRVCIMDQGKIIADGTKAQLIEQYDKTRGIKLKTESNGPELLNKMSAIPHVLSVTQDKETKEISVRSAEDKWVFKNIIDLLHEENIGILSMEFVQPNLETVFLNLTGRVLRD
jgi:ABC-2 type transport system ATP-binding protein